MWKNHETYENNVQTFNENKEVESIQPVQMKIFQSNN